jgi:hypothetical protein
MLRTVRVVAFGLLIGLLTSILGMVTFYAAVVWDDRRRISNTTSEPPYLSAVWSALTDHRDFPFWAIFSSLLTMNSGIGALAGSRGSLRAAPVAVIPVLLILCAMPTWALSLSDRNARGSMLFVEAFAVLFVWVAGRFGQEVGWRQRPAEQAAAPDPAGR